MPPTGKANGEEKSNGGASPFSSKAFACRGEGEGRPCAGRRSEASAGAATWGEDGVVRRNISIVDEDTCGEPLTVEVEDEGLPLLLVVRPPPSAPAMCSMRRHRPEVHGVEDAARHHL
jgi:hypothetical protein